MYTGPKDKVYSGQSNGMYISNCTKEILREYIQRIFKLRNKLYLTTINIKTAADISLKSSLFSYTYRQEPIRMGGLSKSV